MGWVLVEVKSRHVGSAQGSWLSWQQVSLEAQF